MGKNSGRTRNTTSNGRQAITERGYSRRLQRNILARKNNIRNNRDESLHYFSDTGDELRTYQGVGASVVIPKIEDVPGNAIITHNHPRSIGKQGVLAIGNSFSVDDLVTAMKSNAQEIRAVTPTYTFSMRRPKDGWNATEKEIRSVYRIVNDAIKTKLQGYIDDVDTNDAINRANALHFHMVNRRVAQEFGWTYTKKKG